MFKPIQTIVLAMLCSFSSLKAQEPINNKPPQKQAIKGKVISAANGEALPGATIKIHSINKTLTTNDNGEFNINLPTGKYNLSVYSLGYKTQNIDIVIPLKEPLVITLIPNEQNLKEVEVVSTGYQNIPKERATGSFSRPDKKMFNARISPDIISRLEGITTGLLFNASTTNTRENRTDINIRGRSTIYANDQPLIIVDNFPYNGNIADINPQDVASIDVLKDAAASSIWGVKAGNGVIVITTKKGTRNQKTQISVAANVTIGEKPNLKYDPNFISSGDYLDIQQFLFRKGKYDPDLSNTISYPAIPSAIEIMAARRSGLISKTDSISSMEQLKTIDIRDGLLKYFYKNQVNQQYAFNLNSGTENSTYYFSAGFDKGQSSVKTMINDRLTLSFSNVYNPIKNLEFTTQLNYVLAHNDSGNPITLGSISSVGGIYYPYTAFADEYGNPLSINRGFNSGYRNRALESGFLNWNYTPLSEINAEKNRTKTTELRILSSVKYMLLEDLSIDAKYQYEQYNTTSSNLQSLDLYSTRDLINRYSMVTDGKVSGYNLPLGAIFSPSDSFIASNNLRTQLNYRHPGKHSINAIMGIEFLESKYISRTSKFYGYDNETDNFTVVNNKEVYPLNPNGSGSISSGMGIKNGIDRYRSLYASATYAYLNKYTVSASARKDGSNYFGVKTNQKTVPLWSAGIKWDISSENFFSTIPLVSLQLRATYGFNGNLNKSITGITTFKYNTNDELTNLPYATVSNLGNPELRWEKNSILNFGLDFVLKNGVLSGSLEYYMKKGTDLIADQLLAPSVGYLSPATATNVLRGNFADTKGHGFDVQLTSTNLDRAIKWFTTINFSFAADKVTQYDQINTRYGSFVGTGSSILPFIGKPVYALYSYKSAGLNNSTGDPQGFINNLVSQDYNALNNPASLSDLVYEGPSRPQYFGGISNQFFYKRISILFNISFKLGYHFRRSTISYANLLGIAGAGHRDYSSRWQNPGDEATTTVPSLIYPANQQRDLFYSNSEATAERGDHIRLKDLNIGYDIVNPNKVKKGAFRMLQLFFYANNLGILWKANSANLDPDFPLGGIPNFKTVSIGIKASL